MMSPYIWGHSDPKAEKCFKFCIKRTSVCLFEDFVDIIDPFQEKCRYMLGLLALEGQKAADGTITPRTEL